MNPDFTFIDGGSVILLFADSARAEAWRQIRIPPDAIYLGDGVAIERRFFPNIIKGIEADGLTIASAQEGGH